MNSAMNKEGKYKVVLIEPSEIVATGIAAIINGNPKFSVAQTLNDPSYYNSNDSDVDILVSLKRPSLYLYAALKNDLESILSREVDIISAKSKLREEFKQSISEDLIYV